MVYREAAVVRRSCKMLNNLAACNSGESEKNIYAEHINFNKETQIVTMITYFSESYEIFMPLMACVRGIEKFITPGENNFANLLLLVGFGDRYRARI